MTATPPHADLLALAARALMAATLPGAHPNDRAFAVADAVLAAVLPEHRRMVLTEAAKELGRRTDGTWSDPTIGRGIRYAHSVVVMLARESAAAAPPAGLSAPVPAGNTPAVPEEADGQPAGEGDALAAAAAKANRDPTTVRAVQRWMALDLWMALGDDPTAFDAAIEVTSWADTWADLLGRVRGLTAERDRLAGELYEAQMMIERLTADDDARDGTRRAWLELEHWRTVIVPELREQRDRLGTDRDRLAYQVAHYQRVVETAKAFVAAIAGATEEDDWGEEPFPTRIHELAAAVDALPDAGPHQHECACNRNWGGPCGPCVCEEPPRQGVWRLTCGAGNIPPNQTYATKGAAEDVMRLHDGACSSAHAVEFVPDAGTDQTEEPDAT